MERSGGKGLRGNSSPLGKRWLNQGWWKINSTATFSILSECVYLCCYYIKIIVKEADHFLMVSQRLHFPVATWQQGRRW